MGKSAGKIMPLPRGAYDENATYNILDMVTLDNKLWIATRSGVTGITPSKTATEWMMAVDGTTDVKALETEVDAKFASIDEQFLAKDTQISGLNTRVTAAEGSITELDGKFVFDSKPTKGSTNLISSGAAYDMLNWSSDDITSDTDYEKTNKEISLTNGYGVIYGDKEQLIPFDDGTFLHRIMRSSVRLNDASVWIWSENDMLSDSTAANYYPSEARLSVNADSIGFSIENECGGSGGSAVLYMQHNRFYSQVSDVYDLGGSNNKFKDIYASNGTIQTSDVTEKKDIYDLDSDLVRSIVMGLRPVSFKFINGTSDRTHYGLVAQEVEETVNGLGISNKDFAPLIKSAKEDEEGNVAEGEYVYGLRYAEFVGLLIKMCQNLQNEVDELKARLGGA